MFETVDTPRLILDRGRLKQNAERFLDRAEQNKILLRPHLKTAKSIDVARIGTAGRLSRITVSTLREAEYFASHGYKDILYSVGIVPRKFPRVRKIVEQYDCDLILITDNVPVARAAAEFARKENCRLDFLIELDCGEHRGGIACGGAEILEIGRMFHDCANIKFKGVMTHAGHSYACEHPQDVSQVAESERLSVVEAADRLSQVGIFSEIISVGSTPTFLFAKSFDGLTEVRAGVYLFFDLAQYSRKICTLDQIAVSVLSTVIGHNPQGRSIIIDAGAFALSKDFGANTFLPDAAFGYVCDPDTLERFGSLSVANVHQEHGTIPIDHDSWFDRLPIGSLVRVLPNHACATAACYPNYLVIENGAGIGDWPRVNGWQGAPYQ